MLVGKYARVGSAADMWETQVQGQEMQSPLHLELRQDFVLALMELGSGLTQ